MDKDCKSLIEKLFLRIFMRFHKCCDRMEFSISLKSFLQNYLSVPLYL